MKDNPFAPPKADIAGKPLPASPWHVLAVAIGVGLLGLWAFGASVVGLTNAAMPDLPLWFYYLALLPPLLTLCSAYCLWRGSKWAIVLLIITPLIGLSGYLFVFRVPEISLATAFAGQLFERLPTQQIIQLGMFGLVALYAAFLYK